MLRHLLNVGLLTYLPLQCLPNDINALLKSRYNGEGKMTRCQHSWKTGDLQTSGKVNSDWRILRVSRRWEANKSISLDVTMTWCLEALGSSPADATCTETRKEQMKSFQNLTLILFPQSIMLSKQNFFAYPQDYIQSRGTFSKQ